MLGVATFILVMSGRNGFREDVIERILGIHSHITIYSNDFSNSQKVLDIVKQVPNVKNANRIIENQVMLMANNNSSGAAIKGIEKDDIKTKDKIYSGIKNEFDFNDNEILLGNSLLNKLGVFIGDNVKVISPELNSTLIGVIPRIKTYKIVGIFSSGMYEYDAGVVFIPLKTAQKHFSMGNKVSGIEIYLDRLDLTKQTLNTLIVKLSDNGFNNLKIMDWQNSNAEFIGALDVERNVMFIILTLIILVATFNIVSSLTMLVNDKLQQIALMRTIGFTKQSVMRIFFISGSLIGFLGTFFGVALGILIAKNLQSIKLFLESKFNIQLFPASVYLLTELPSKIIFSDIIYIVGISMSMSFLSTLYPAYKAAKTNPSEILRYQ
jgi:lipoprotein-releasing system permease protein